MYYRIASLFVLVLYTAGFLRADDTELTPQEFDLLQRLIRPQPDESQWAAVAWLINLQDARERAAREDNHRFCGAPAAATCRIERETVAAGTVRVSFGRKLIRLANNLCPWRSTATL